jgi:N-acetylmuramoyl-L-alanine amidase
MVLTTLPAQVHTGVVGAPSGPLADALLASLAADVSTISTLTATDDPVMAGSGLAAVRIRLGSFASAADAALFGDPRWLESIASDIYRALAQLYGRQ